MGTGQQTSFPPNAFGPFGALFQTYFTTLEGISQGRSAFDAQAATAQISAPIKAAARCQLEILGLVNRRTQAYLQVPARLAHCRTPQDLLNEQMAFWRTAAAQYSEASRKVFDAWASADLWSADGRAAATERDYINFNGTGSKEGGTQRTWPETPTGGKQRRVA
jgi:hypothetical protein